MKIEDLRNPENLELLQEAMANDVYLCPKCGHIFKSHSGGLQVKCTSPQCSFIMSARQMMVEHQPVCIRPPLNWKQVRDRNTSPGYCVFDRGIEPKQMAKFLCSARMS